MAIKKQNNRIAPKVYTREIHTPYFRKSLYCAMRALIQRVRSASVIIDGHEHSAIHRGILVLLGIDHADTEEDILWLCNKICGLRIFSDEEGKMNLDLKQIAGQLMVVSQFTLHASYKKGNRPSYIRAARPDQAIPLYEKFLQTIENISGQTPASGLFGADMQLCLINDGPVTIMLDSKEPE